MLTSPQIHLLTEIHCIEDPAAQRGAFRKAMADLAAVVAEQHPVPLEGLDPQELELGLQACQQGGLLDELSFISAPAALVAMYHVASYLPKGTMRAQLSRRISASLKRCDGLSFTALSAVLAIGSPDPFSEPTMRSRVELSLEIGFRTDHRAVDALALSLISRPQLQAAWLTDPATSSLPARRRTALIIERAAGEAARRYAQGDDGVLQVFLSDAVRAGFVRLLQDRESLVWRYVAVARGLLAPLLPELDAEVSSHLDPALSPTEWRRAVVSEVASIAARGERGLARCMRILQGPLPKRDRGLPGAMIFGIARAMEVEPRAAEALLLHLVEQGGDYALETLTELVHEENVDEQGRVRRLALKLIKASLAQPDISPSRTAQLQLYEEQLGEVFEGAAEDARQVSLPRALQQAQRCFGEEGPQRAADRAERLLLLAQGRLTAIEQKGFGTQVLGPLWELDRVLLQSTTLDNLLRLDADRAPRLKTLEELRDRLHRFLLRGDQVYGDVGLHMRRLVSLLHAVDAESVDHAGQQRRRQLDTVRVLLNRVPEASTSALDRVQCATLARAFDALLESGGKETSDILLVAARFVTHERGLRILAEASMDPQLEQVLGAYANLLASSAEIGSDAAGRDQALHDLQALSAALPVASSPRSEALRKAMVDLYRALETLSRVPALGLLSSEHGAVLPRLAEAVHTLAQLSFGAARRFYLLRACGRRTECGQHVFALQAALEGAAMAGEHVELSALLPPLLSAFLHELPRPLAELSRCVLEELVSLPMQAAPGAIRSIAPPPQVLRLPAWLPPSRVLGGFYVLDTLGEGAVGSVFVATRLEDRGKVNATRFALKVPTYDGRAARALSEQEFLDSFRREAGALLALPADHPNIAAFVTFDAGAMPKPVLVMELVKGPSLARLLARRRLTAAHGLSWLQGVACGLCAMHGLGIGHLDVKPANIIVRAQTSGEERDGERDEEREAEHQAVLVDFGLSGRALRAGCATSAYGAPEIWGMLPEPSFADPRPADVYAFACTVFEVLCAQDLFAGHDDMALISAHITHDGEPARLAQLREQTDTGELVALLSDALRRDPRARIDMEQFRQRLTALAPRLGKLAWPLLPVADSAAA